MSLGAQTVDGAGRPGGGLTLGIWDGHDAGVALVCGGEIVFAANEERFTRRKLEVGFPQQSLEALFSFQKIKPENISRVAISTSDVSKTLSRVVPSLKEQYYLTRRRKKAPGYFNTLIKRLKYPLTELPSCMATRFISRRVLTAQLRNVGIYAPLEMVDHHAAHAATAICASGFDDSLVLTLDGIGDGLSGSIWSYRDGKLVPLRQISGKNSLGIFFEHVTNLLHMRELEDEGKVMALANFTYALPDSENPLLRLFNVHDMNISSRYSSLGLYRELDRIYYYYPAEQFAYFAQRTLELKVLELVQQALTQTRHRYLAYAGGLASNVKVNMLLRGLDSLEDLFVFPHMGDGGLAVGAALWAEAKGDRLGQGSIHSRELCSMALRNVYLGPSYEAEISDIAQSLSSNSSFHVHESPDIADEVAKLLADGEIVFWYQGRMEYGPRSLGARSILALPSSISLKDKLNVTLKKRCWYQPFCPSMLEEDAYEMLSDLKGSPNRFMTSAYIIKDDKRHLIQGTMNVDGSCRPQILARDEQSVYPRLLCKLKERTGVGVVLNTSFNIHGEPIVCSPKDAVHALKTTNVNYLALGSLLVRKI